MKIKKCPACGGENSRHPRNPHCPGCHGVGWVEVKDINEFTHTLGRVLPGAREAEAYFEQSREEDFMAEINAYGFYNEDCEEGMGWH